MQYLKEQVRERILSAARAEFTVNGFSRASIRTIALNSGISLGNIYRYFTDKEALFLAVVGTFTDGGVELCEKHFDFSQSSLDAYAALLLEFLNNNEQSLDILLKGPQEHFTAFIEQQVEAYFCKLSAYLSDVCPDANEVLANSQLYRTLCVSFIQGLTWIIRNVDKQSQQQEITRLIWFFFGDVKHKFDSCPL